MMTEYRAGARVENELIVALKSARRWRGKGIENIYCRSSEVIASRGNQKIITKNGGANTGYANDRIHA